MLSNPTLMPPVIRRSPILAACAALLLALGPIAATAEAALKPSLNTKTVCDWSFVSGPRQGQHGTESRRFHGSWTALTATTWWAGGGSGKATHHHSNGIASVNPTTTVWDVRVNVGSRPPITAKLTVRGTDLTLADPQRLTFSEVSNGAYVDCLELGTNARHVIDTIYNCRCGSGFDFASTVACVSSCAARWNDPAKWANRPVPACLAGSSIVEKTACMLDNNPHQLPGPGPSPDPDPLPGPGHGDACGVSQLCKPGCFCDSRNTCVCNDRL